MAKVEIIKRGNIKTKLYMNGELLTDFSEEITDIDLPSGKYGFGVSSEKSLKAEQVEMKNNNTYIVDITYDFRFFVTGMIIALTFAIYGFSNAIGAIEDIDFKIIFLPLAFIVFLLTFKLTQLVIVYPKDK